MGSQTLVLIVSLTLVLVVTGMIAFLMAGGKSSQKKRTMNVIRGATLEDGKKRVNAQDARRDALSKKLKDMGLDDTEEKKSGNTIADWIIYAGLTISVSQFWIFSTLFAVVATALVVIMGKGPVIIVSTAIISFFGVPRFVVKKMAANRQKKFLADLADVFESMVRLLKAGMPVSEAIKMVAREFTGPIGDEMGRIFDQQKVGVSLSDAVASCAKRMPLTEMQMFSTAISIQAQTGSSLSEVFENLAKTVRARFRLKRKIRALSSEAKSSAAIIAALPVLVALGMWGINPDYIGLLFTTMKGKLMLSGAIFWMFLGVMSMRQMINFKI